MRGLRIGVPKELNEAEGIEPGVAAAVQAAIAKLEELGAEVGECSLPLSVEYGMACYYLITPAEASSNLARYDGVRYGFRADADERLEMYERTRNEGFGDEPKRRIMVGTYALSAGYYDAYYGQAQKVRTVIKREHDALFETFDALVSPTSPTVAFPLGARTADPIAMYLSDLLTIPVLHGRPAGAQRPVRALGGPSGRAAARGAAVRREHALPHRPCPRAGDRLRSGPGAAPVTYRFEDPAAEFVLAVERIFGEHPRVLDSSRAVLVGDVKLQLEAGERELWLIETHGPLEHWVAMVRVEDDVEEALREAKEKLDAAE